MAITNPNSPRFRRIFAQQQTGGSYPTNFRVINNSSGTWTSTGAQMIRAEQGAITMTPNMPITPVPWLTGTREAQPGIGGRMGASWSLRGLPLIPSGTVGTVPDIDILLQNIFGQASSNSTGTGCAYTALDNGYLPFTLFDFPHNIASLTSRIEWGCFVSSFTISLNGNILTIDLDGQGGYMLDSDYFSSEPTVAKAGLTAWPTEPSAPTYNGATIPGFGATCTVDGQTGLELQMTGLVISGSTGFEIIGDVLADGYGVQAVGGLRSIGISSMSFIDSASAGLVDLKQKAKARSSVTFTATIGTTAGSKFKFDGLNCQLSPNSLEDSGNRVIASFPSASFHPSSVGNVDSFTLTAL